MPDRLSHEDSRLGSALGLPPSTYTILMTFHCSPALVVTTAVSPFALVVAVMGYPWWAMGLVAALVAFLFGGSFIPQWRIFLPVVCHGERGVRRVALTFDDGPSPEATLPLLDLLDTYGVRATFFVIGQKAAAHPSLLDAILAKGHTIGNHSFSHDPLLNFRSTASLTADIAQCQQLLESRGIRSRLYRPPVGVTTPRLPAALRSLNLVCAGFSVKGFDWGNHRTGRLSARILGKVRPGDVILLHDCVPGPSFDVQAWLREVEALLQGLAARGLEVGTFEEVTAFSAEAG